MGDSQSCEDVKGRDQTFIRYIPLTNTGRRATRAHRDCLFLSISSFLNTAIKYFFFSKHYRDYRDYRDDLFSYFYIDDAITAIKYFRILNITAITVIAYFWFQTLP